MFAAMLQIKGLFPKCKCTDFLDFILNLPKLCLPPAPPAAPKDATKEVSAVSVKQYPGETVPVCYGGVAVGNKGLDEDMSCEMILQMMDK